MMRASKTYFEVREKKTKELKSRLADSVFDGLEKRVPFHLRFGMPQDSASCSVRLIGAGALSTIFILPPLPRRESHVKTLAAADGDLTTFRLLLGLCVAEAPAGETAEAQD